jgi:hypothetical protein
MQTNHPDKYKVRQFMQQRQAQRTPPPSPEETRRQLGWGLVEAERACKPR